MASTGWQRIISAEMLQLMVINNGKELQTYDK